MKQLGVHQFHSAHSKCYRNALPCSVMTLLVAEEHLPISYVEWDIQ